jgi:hypothetical protein
MFADTKLKKLKGSLPWLARYPFWRIADLFGTSADGRPGHVILTIANHFEPGYNEEPNEHGGFGIALDWSTQIARLDHWCEQARKIGAAVRDHDGTPFRHTNFYPAEQYHKPLLDRLAALQSEGLGEVEIHLHHGVDKPDTAESFKRVLVDFRDVLAEEHKCLSRLTEDGPPMYAFVHGNWALANSANGKFCGVDSEMQILAETGCYADLTLPSAPDVSQVPRINAIYQCGRPLDQRSPHRSGPNLRVGQLPPTLPVLITGPLLFDWQQRKAGIPWPRLENGALTAKSSLKLSTFQLWRNAHIAVRGRPEWIFVKLYCHGFFDIDQPKIIGSEMTRFLQEVLGYADRTGEFKLHFASAREAFNMVSAAIDGHEGNPGDYRDYRLKPIMKIDSRSNVDKEYAGTSVVS